MVEYVLAKSEDTSWISAAIYAVLFVGGGIALIVVGIRRRVARVRWQREDDRRLLHAGEAAFDDDRPAAVLPGGGWFIASGAVLLVLGLGHVLHIVVTLHVNGMI